MDSYIDSLFDVKGKIAVVIGGGGHLCSELSRGLAKAGCSVAIADIRLKKVQAIEDELKKEGFTDIISLEVDVANKQDHINALEKVLSSFGQVDVLVNGAGINSPTPFFDITVEEWDAIMDSQIKGTLLGCQVFGKQMVKQGNGSIVNISSASAGPPLSKAFTYSVAKAGIKNLTQNLGREWGEKGVRVNALRPGFFPTEWNRKNFITPDRERSILGHTPMARYGEPKELVGATIWLASDASSFVTGTEIVIDGGFSCMTV